MRLLLPLLLVSSFTWIHAIDIPERCFEGAPVECEVETLRYEFLTHPNGNRCMPIEGCPEQTHTFDTFDECYETCVTVHPNNACNPPQSFPRCEPDGSQLTLYILREHKCERFQWCHQYQGTFLTKRECVRECLNPVRGPCKEECSRIYCKFPKTACGEIGKGQCGCYEPKRVQCADRCSQLICPSDTICGFYNGYCGCHRSLKQCKSVCEHTTCEPGSTCQSQPWGECGCAPDTSVCEGNPCGPCGKCVKLACSVGSLCPDGYRCDDITGPDCPTVGNSGIDGRPSPPE